MKKIRASLLTLCLSLVTSIGFAQKIEFKTFDYTNKEYKIADKYEKSDVVILERDLKSEFVLEDKQLVEYVLFHEKKQINSDNGIEANNKIYVPSKLSSDLLVNKLRVIRKNGTVLELKESDIKEEVNEQNQVRYSYFAVKGLEKGAVIEQIYMLKRAAEFTGNSIRFQSQYPILKATLELIYPETVVFSSASYNGLPDAVGKLNAYEGKNSLTLSAENIDPLPVNERQSNIEKNAKRIAYKLNENLNTGAKNLFNHNDYAKELFEQYHAPLSKNDVKAIEQFVKQIKSGGDELDKIRAVEQLIKDKINFNRYFNTNKSTADVIQNKQGDYFDLIRLYVQVLKTLDIQNEIVFTTERFEDVFDPNFESYLNFKDVLFYFPKSKVYVEPAATVYRTPLFDPQYGGNFGLFIKTSKYLDIEVPVSEVRTIAFPQNQDKSIMNISVDFTADVMNPRLKSKITFNGFESLNFQPAKDFSDPDEYNEMVQFIAKNYAIDSNVEKVEVENEGVVNLGKKPFILNLETNAQELVTKAGASYLFKVGQVIGKQMEMYDEKERVFPIEIDNPHSYDRTISIKIPDGYKIKNPEVFRMNHSLEYKGKVVADFISDYEIKGNVLTVRNTETYDFVEIPATLYPQYQKVINAAADFNKLSIIIEKI